MEFKFVQMTGQTLFYGLKEIQLWTNKDITFSDLEILSFLNVMV